MHLKFDDINTAFSGLVRSIHNGRIITESKPSRVGEVLQIPEPVILTYADPRKRVLFNQARDANPFFHVYESLWMLAGRNDIASLDYYSSGYSKQVDDGNGIANGAYGYRWRNFSIPDAPQISKDGCNVDQLDVLIEHLKRKPESRRAVLQMWNCEDDLLKLETSKDVCCNTCVYFSIQTGEGFPSQVPRWLDMTVSNRSNDLIWGALGANYVHFSFLQEYMACALGLEVGVYNQISNNLHVYTERWKPEEWLAEYGTEAEWRYVPEFTYFPLVSNRERFDQEVCSFVETHSATDTGLESNVLWSEPFLRYVAYPMMMAFHFHKDRKYEGALEWVNAIEATDWQWAARNWLKKRRMNWENKVKGEGVYDNA